MCSYRYEEIRAVYSALQSLIAVNLQAVMVSSVHKCNDGVLCLSLRRQPAD